MVTKYKEVRNCRMCKKRFILSGKSKDYSAKVYCPSCYKIYQKYREKEANTEK